MNNKPIILKGYSAAKLNADFRSPDIKPGNPHIPYYKRIMWDEATQEQKDTLNWVTSLISGRENKSAVLPLTPQEKKILAENKHYHQEQMYIYLLENYGNDYAHKFLEEVALNRTDLKIYPHCKYANGQCDMFCDYYKEGVCIYENRY